MRCAYACGPNVAAAIVAEQTLGNVPLANLPPAQVCSQDRENRYAVTHSVVTERTPSKHEAYPRTANRVRCGSVPNRVVHRDEIENAASFMQSSQPSLMFGCIAHASRREPTVFK